MVQALATAVGEGGRRIRGVAVRWWVIMTYWRRGVWDGRRRRERGAVGGVVRGAARVEAPSQA